jgi:WD40 repeat protein
MRAVSIQTLLTQASERKSSIWLRPLTLSLTGPGRPLIRIFEGHTDSVSAVAVTADGCRAVSASWDQTLRLWDLESGQTIRPLEGHNSWVNAVAVMPDGRRAVSASHDRTLRLWDLESGKEIATFTGESDMASCAVTSDGQTILAGKV